MQNRNLEDPTDTLQYCANHTGIVYSVMLQRFSVKCVWLVEIFLAIICGITCIATILQAAVLPAADSQITWKVRKAKKSTRELFPKTM